MAHTGTAGVLRRLMGMLPLHGRSTANFEDHESEGDLASASVDGPLMCAVNIAANSASFEESDSNKENTMPITENDRALCDDVSVAPVNHRARWQPPCVSLTLGNAQIAAKTSLVIVTFDTEPKKILGKKGKNLPLFLCSYGTSQEEVEEARNRGSFLATFPNFLGIP